MTECPSGVNFLQGCNKNSLRILTKVDHIWKSSIFGAIQHTFKVHPWSDYMEVVCLLNFLDKLLILSTTTIINVLETTDRVSLRWKEDSNILIINPALTWFRDGEALDDVIGCQEVPTSTDKDRLEGTFHPFVSHSSPLLNINPERELEFVICALNRWS